MLVLAALAGVIGLSWWWLVRAARDMYGAMDGPAAWMMDASWDARYLALICAMWAVMMAAMMLPSAIPAVLMYQRVMGGPQWSSTAARTVLFAAGYLLAWSAFSVIATVLQWQLARAALVSPMMQSTRPLLDGVLLMGAGLYQWLPLKRSCLALCRAPADFLAHRFRPGAGGALIMGLQHGMICIGCCWALMLLLFVGGVMNLA
ncbi:MAG TPA: DUF2182 domain-containing protein, partial [Nevskiaceae bacterium]|nr:DUF2182 domain-containing protein [Nevskiaceae bacterium]